MKGKTESGMEYLTIAEIARKWGVSERRVAQMCNAGKIEGAYQERRMWQIPANAVKPRDNRVVYGAGDMEERRIAQKNTLGNNDSNHELREHKDQSVDLILCEIPVEEDETYRKPVVLSRLWTEYRRIIKPEGYVVLLSAGKATASIILSNQDEYKFSLVWQSRFSSEAGPGKSHMDVTVFTYKGDGRIRTENIEKAQGEDHIFKMAGDVSDVLCFTEYGGEPVRDVHMEKQALGAFLACAFSNPGDYVLDNAAYEGDLIAGAFFAGHQFKGNQNDVQRAVELPDEDIARMGIPGDAQFCGVPSALMRSRRERLTITEHYNNLCWRSLYKAWRMMPEERRALIERSPLTDEFDSILAEEAAARKGSAE